MRKKDRIRSRMKKQLADYYLATAAVSKTKVTTISPPQNNFEAKISRMRQERDSLKDYYLATAISTTKKVETSSPNNYNFETKNEKTMVVAEAEAEAPPSTSFAQEILSFWCTAFGDIETESTSHGFCSSNNTICSCGTKDDSSSSDNRNPDGRNPTTKKKSSSDFGRRDDFRNPYTMTSPSKITEDANSLLTGNESDKITSHPASPPPRSNDDVNIRRNWEKESVKSTLALADETTISDESTIESIESPPPLNRKSKTQPRLQ